MCPLLWLNAFLCEKTFSAEGKAPSPFRVLLQGDTGPSHCKVAIKNTFHSLVSLEITKAPEFYGEESAWEGWKLFGEGTAFFWTSDATEQKDALCSAQAFQSCNKTRASHTQTSATAFSSFSFPVPSLTPRLCTKHSQHRDDFWRKRHMLSLFQLILFIYLFICHLLHPLKFFRVRHTKHFINISEFIFIVTPLWTVGAASFALHVTASGTKEGFP